MNIKTVLGCLSPYEVGLSIHISHVAAAFAIGATLGAIVLSWHQRRFDWLSFYGVLVILHPAWTMEAMGGDCGYAKRFFSVAASLLCAALILCQAFRPGFSRRKLLLIICAVSWVLWLLLFVPRLLHFPIPSPEGFIGETVQAFVMASGHILRVSLVLSLICIVWWLVSRFSFDANRPNQTLPVVAYCRASRDNQSHRESD